MFDCKNAGASLTPALQLRIGFVLLPDFTLMALTGFIEALRIAGDDIDHSRNRYCSWEIMSPGSALIRSSSGLSVQPTSKLQTPENFDYVVVIGGLLEAQDRVDPAIIDYVRDAGAKGVPLVGACTGSFLLARAGLMEGRRCCIHQFHVSEFQAEFPALTIEPDRLFVIDGPRITCPGGASASDLAIHLIQRHCGRDRALKTVSLLLFDEARSANHPQARTALDLSVPVQDPLVRRALLIMQQNISPVMPVGEIARTLGTNIKKLERAFHAQLAISPAQTYRRIRLERALWLVEHSRKSMAEIAYECGYADASHFSRMFRDAFDVSPSAVRAQHSPVAIAPMSETRRIMPLVMPS
ncbi:GlxA family transcriptional regulator [uncultured Sphingosinicella sp.]|uniref:GlxA family transcriptional regulator n=1 Tax=uncultured Sphingosinicella sp. TaxID=478748 RepID=UPI0030DB7B4D|tara:strand:+ start:3870 stop:4934 length:1065 start_codon:yes stop_codon:yes gene_type:complete